MSQLWAHGQATYLPRFLVCENKMNEIPAERLISGDSSMLCTPHASELLGIERWATRRGAQRSAGHFLPSAHPLLSSYQRGKGCIAPMFRFSFSLNNRIPTGMGSQLFGISVTFLLPLQLEMRVSARMPRAMENVLQQELCSSLSPLPSCWLKVQVMARG